MELTPLGIEGAWLAESPVWSDDRGFFREWFKREEIFSKTGIDFSPQQANISVSNKGVIRGIHYSLAPEGQAKWITCVTGSIIDVIVDIRPNSPTYKKIEYIKLKGNECSSLLIGEGLGHGFISLEDGTSLSYLLSSPYFPEAEFEILPTDETLKVNWHRELVGEFGIVLSPKDAKAPTLEDRKVQGKLPQWKQRT
jgi:dTDP-4-dehydrorhamnose 3,5-epimerase